MSTLQTGEIVGGYRLARRISRGGMGEVWEAERTVSGFGFSKRLAIKVILPTLTDESHVNPFLTEARMTARLEHPSSSSMATTCAA
jgi:serine/threonine-protein kinase